MRSKQAAGRERRAFSAEFKAEAVRMMQERRSSGMSLAEISRELEVRPEQLRLWARLQTEGNRTDGPAPGETLEQENRRLRRELATLKQEQAFVKKVAVGSMGRCNIA